ncbi:MAG: hypothetical protein IKU90_06655 [Clostridia bacterium]|nr:hypothetical protein [Clostridia bacterium]
MANYKRVNEPTPNGGTYSEIHFFNDVGEQVDETKATRCVIRECMSDGTLIQEYWGICNQE